MITTVNASGKRVMLEENGNFRIFPTDFSSFSCVSAVWSTDDIAASGILTFSVDGDKGVNPEFSVIDLSRSGQGGSRTCASNMDFAFIDVEVSNLPPKGKVMLFLR